MLANAERSGSCGGEPTGGKARVQRERERIEIVRFWHGARGFPHIPGKF
jgi:hypothetical protein